ncbi:pectate lyase family protein [Streptomyces boninensis]|uniref:pectate lyase family protein n=1 Tax=Streptomyces boninensis TaxID=2039455 RepID=UPI003B219A2C
MTAATVTAAALLIALPTAQADPPPHAPGWASAAGGTTGGAGADDASVWTVRTRADLARALGNHGAPTSPKRIRVEGDIDGHQAADGTHLGEQDYAPGYDLARYMSCFGADGAEWSDTRHPYCKEQRALRQKGSDAEKRQVQLTIPSNTTLEGIGKDARLLGVMLSVNTGRNIIVRNLEIEAPVDHFTTWSPGDGEDGSWNARLDAMSLVTGRNIWIDHCTFTDGRYPDRDAPDGFHGEPVQRHDGLLDIEDGSDHVTVSDSRFTDHDKALLIGSGDGDSASDRGHLKVTFLRNLFTDIVQRAPRVRYGQVHAVNNVYRGSGAEYALGIGLESAIESERNVFDYDEATDPAVTTANLGGDRFNDTGSWFNGRHVDLNALAAAEAPGDFSHDTGWRPADAYDYDALKSAAAVRRHVLAHAGPDGG